MAVQRTRCSTDETKQWLFPGFTVRREFVLRTNIRRDRLHVASKDAYLLQNWQQVGRQVDCHSWPHCSDLHDVGPCVLSHCRCCLHTLHTDHPQPSLQSITTTEMILSSATLIPSQFSCEIWSFHSSILKKSSLLKCDAVLGKWFPIFERSQSLHIQGQTVQGHLTPKMNHSPNNTASYPRRPESSWFHDSMYST